MGQLYTKFKVFQYKTKIDSLPQGVDQITPPIHIRIKPTNVCNHHCWYCAYKSKDLQLGQDMAEQDQIPKDKMMEIIDDLVEMEVKAVTFSGGGEPFVYPHLLDTVKKLAQTPIQFASLTNGARLEGELAEVFAHHATWLRVSMDGWDDESYSEYRGCRIGSFSKLMKNLESFKKLDGKCYLSVVIIVDQKNAEHLYSSIERLKNIGIDSVKISGCIVSNDGEKNNEYHQPIFQNVKEQIQKAKQDFSDEKFELFDSYHELDDKFGKEYTWCPYLQILPIIGADLNIYPCQDKAYNLEEGLLGSIKEQRFKDFWFSDKNVFYKINPSEHCNHHCVANLKNKMLLEYLDVDPKHGAFV
jgi:MoaA/NifB/PqqE/SkfB family radical SAM enzyme